MINSLKKLSARLHIKGLSNLSKEIDSIISLSELKTTITAEELINLKPDVLETLKKAVLFDLILDTNDGKSIVKAIPHIHKKWTDGLAMGNINNLPEIKNIFNNSSSQEIPMRNAKIINTLIKVADKLDQKGREDLAEKVDETINVFVARPRAPLKGLEESVKKNLLSFLYNANKNISDSLQGLEELFRRLRYFDVDFYVKELGLDKTREMLRATSRNLDEASKCFYEITYGRKPSKEDVDSFMADDKKSSKDPLEFFESQKQKLDCDKLNDDKLECLYDRHDNDIEEEIQQIEHMYDEYKEDVSSEEIDNFWKTDEINNNGVFNGDN